MVTEEVLGCLHDIHESFGGISCFHSKLHTVMCSFGSASGLFCLHPLCQRRIPIHWCVEVRGEVQNFLANLAW